MKTLALGFPRAASSSHGTPSMRATIPRFPLLFGSTVEWKSILVALHNLERSAGGTPDGWGDYADGTALPSTESLRGFKRRSTAAIAHFEKDAHFTDPGFPETPIPQTDSLFLLPWEKDWLIYFSQENKCELSRENTERTDRKPRTRSWIYSMVLTD
jgi:hypothetical protein